MRNTSAFTIITGIVGDFSGKVIPRHDNFSYMIEIDPRAAEAARKQYNWGRQIHFRPFPQIRLLLSGEY